MLIRKNVQEYKNIRQFAYSTIKDNILSLDLKPGQKISELELVDILQVGKTPIREALIQLAQEDLTTIIPQSGTFITKIDLNQIEEGRHIRQIVEEDTHIKAINFMTLENIEYCQNILDLHQKIPTDDLTQQFHYDELFHRSIYEFCGKIKSFQMIQIMNSDYKRFRLLAFKDVPRFQKVLNEHNQILECIRNKDKQLLKKTTKEHLVQLGGEEKLIANKYQKYFISFK